MAFFRMVIVGLCLAGIATMLQGCGGDSSGGSGHGVGPPAKGCTATAASDKCMCTSFDFATGTSTATLNIGAEVEMPGMFMPVAEKLDLTLKMDVDTMEVRLDMAAEVANENAKKMGYEKVAVKLIVDSAKQVMVTHTTMDGMPAVPGPQPPPCQVTSLGLSRQQLKEKVDQARLMSDTVLQCKGNDGTFDSWQVNKAVAPPGLLPPPPFAADAIIKSDNAHRLKSISLTAENIPRSAGPAAKTAEIKGDFTPVSDDGPTAADLDYSTWGDCKSGGPPSQDFLTSLSAHHPMLAVLASIRQKAIAAQTQEITV